MNNTTKIAEVMAWGYHTLVAHGYIITNETPELVLNTPWSYIVRFVTSVGYVYFKKTPAAIDLEAPVIEVLRTEFHASVPEVIAYNRALHSFLMKDAGQSLRSILYKQFDAELFCKVIDQFTKLQLATAENLELLLDIGVPEWRLEKLPDLYQMLLLQSEILIEDGLSEADIAKLRALLPQVVMLCQKLLDYPIKQTMVQPDFNDNNTLIDPITGKITLIDLGEIVISQPFFSLVNCLEQLNKRHGMAVTDERYLLLQDACLKNFMGVASKQLLFDALDITERLWPVYWALANYRLHLACDKDTLMAFQMRGRLKHSLKGFLHVCQTL
jgi:hypothetical protein